MEISKRISALEESQTLKVAALCQQMRADGVDVIGLSLGEPDFPAPAHVKQAAIDAVNNDISHYGPTPGFPALREAIAATLNKDLADYLGISEQILSKKINENGTEFKQGEIKQIKIRYNLTADQVDLIFFAE